MIFWGTLLCWPNITISEWLVYINHEFNTILDDPSTIFSYVVPVLPSSRKEVIAKQIRPTISEADSLRKCRCSGGKMKAQQTPVVLQSSMDFVSKNNFCVFFSIIVICFRWVTVCWKKCRRTWTISEAGWCFQLGLFSTPTKTQPQKRDNDSNYCMYVYLYIYIYICVYIYIIYDAPSDLLCQSGLNMVFNIPVLAWLHCNMFGVLQVKCFSHPKMVMDQHFGSSPGESTLSRELGISMYWLARLQSGWTLVTSVVNLVVNQLSNLSI